VHKVGNKIECNNMHGEKIKMVIQYFGATLNSDM